MTITAIIRLFPTPEQARAIDDCAHAYINAASQISQEEYGAPKIRVNAKKIQDRHYQQVRNDYGLKSQMTCSVCKTVAAAYKSIESNEHATKKPALFKHAFFDAVRGKDYTIKDDKIALNTLKEKRIQIDYRVDGAHAELLKCGKLGTAKVIKRHNKHYMHVPVTIEVDDVAEYVDGKTTIVGIDRGIRFLAACYDTDGKTHLYSGKGVIEKRKQFKTKRAELQKNGTPSARRRLKKMGSREHRWMDDVNHCLSKTLVENYPEGTIFVLENLSGIRGSLVMARRRDRYERVSWSYADLASKLEYKAKLHGQRVIYVDPAYSSQECPCCGHKSKANRNKDKHVFKCERCGYESNDDRSAAMGLLGRGRSKVLAELLEHVSEQPGSSQ